MLERLSAGTQRRLLKRAKTPERKANLKRRLAGECKTEPGRVLPLVDIAKCEGKEDCVFVCPYDVFEVGRITDEAYLAQTRFIRFKMRVHGMKTAYTTNLDACRSCGLCVEACPENAITLTTLASRQ